MRKPSLLERLLEQARPEMLLGASGALVLLVAAAGYLYVVKPSVAKYQLLVADRAGASLQLDLEPPSPEPTALSRLEARIKGEREELYGGTAAVSPREMESFVIDTLQRLSAEHATSLESVTPGKPGKVLMFDELPFDVTLSGSYPHLFEWLWQAESELRPMVVKTFNMRTTHKDSVELRLRLVAYVAKEPAK